MKIKEGVIMPGLKLEMRKVLKAAEILWTAHGEELVITSALDGEHSAGSYHYYGYAVDFRTRYFSDKVSKHLALALREKIGSRYYVIFEKNHIHVQFQPA